VLEQEMRAQVEPAKTAPQTGEEVMVTQNEQRTLERLATEYPFHFSDVKEAYHILGDMDLLRKACALAITRSKPPDIVDTAISLRDTKETKSMSEKHTAGPWRVHDLADGPSKTIGPLGVFVAQTLGGNDSANARLIAAAPDLLAACKAAEKYLCSSPSPKSVAAYKEVQAAIAKAEG